MYIATYQTTKHETWTYVFEPLIWVTDIFNKPPHTNTQLFEQHNLSLYLINKI